MLASEKAQSVALAARGKQMRIDARIKAWHLRPWSLDFRELASKEMPGR